MPSFKSTIWGQDLELTEEQYAKCLLLGIMIRRANVPSDGFIILEENGKRVIRKPTLGGAYVGPVWRLKNADACIATVIKLRTGKVDT